jgi:sugar O-acyltransferase (sialic acid O-acetyltransferase NeuD family)
VAAPAERLLVWGAGGHGKVVADLVRALGHEVVGFVDADPDKLDRVAEPGGARVVLAEEELRRLLGDGAELPDGATAVVPAMGTNRTRLAALDVLGHRVAPGLVHPAATVSPSAELGPGTVVFAGAVVNAGARIGRGVIVNTGAVVEHDCQVGDAAHISPGAVLAGGVTIGPRGWVGAGAVVIEGRRIGSDVTVGAGAVVLRDVPDGQTVVGVPARAIGATPVRGSNG